MTHFLDFLAIEARHRNDRDGGYAYADALGEYLGSLSDREQQIATEVLLSWVESERGSSWACALEALVTVGGERVAQRLEELLMTSKPDTEFVDYLVFALLRLGSCGANVRSRCIHGAREGHSMGIPNLARLLICDRTTIDECADCVVHVCLQQGCEALEKRITPWSCVASDASPNLLVELVRAVSRRNSQCGKAFGRMLLDDAKKPWTHAELGEDAVRALEAGIANVLASP